MKIEKINKVVTNAFTKLKKRGFLWASKRSKEILLTFIFHKVEYVLYVKKIASEIININPELKARSYSVNMVVDYNDAFFGFIKEIRPDEKTKTLLGKLKRNDRCFLLKNVDGEIIHVSWVCYKEICDFIKKKLYLKKEEIYIYDCFTKEKYRGLGVYPYMLVHLMRFHKEKGIKKSYIMVNIRNVASSKGIEKAGFARDKIFTSYILFNVFKFTKEKVCNIKT